MKRILLILTLGLSFPAGANPQHPLEISAQQKLQQLYHANSKNPISGIQQRLNQYSELFLNKPYILFSLGEGLDAEFDQKPLYRLDGFDCETYVTTVMALSLSNNGKEFEDIMIKLRYQNQNPSFLNRHHFTDLDWARSNQQAGFLKDITSSIVNEKKQSVSQPAVATIDKAAWFEKVYKERQYLPQYNAHQKQNRASELLIESRKIPPQLSRIHYIPLDVLFDSQGNPVPFIFNQIPDGAIVQIIRPNWALKNIIGTNLNVSHLGFVFIKNHTLMFRHASSEQKKVIEQPLSEYLQQKMNSPSIKGINIQVVQAAPTAKSRQFKD